MLRNSIKCFWNKMEHVCAFGVTLIRASVLSSVSSLCGVLSRLTQVPGHPPSSAQLSSQKPLSISERGPWGQLCNACVPSSSLFGPYPPLPISLLGWGRQLALGPAPDSHPITGSSSGGWAEGLRFQAASSGTRLPAGDDAQLLLSPPPATAPTIRCAGAVAAAATTW